MSLRLPILSLLVAFLPAFAASPETGFLNRAVSSGGVDYRYQVFVPAVWSAARKWPVILFLHGAGERGEDGLVQTEVGLGRALRRHVERFPAVVVIPQCRKGMWWQEAAMEAQALAALDLSVKEFNGDPDRTYLTGLSMGGYGTWAIASRHPGRFAALAPICGGIRLPNRPGVTIPQPPGDDPYGAAAKRIGTTPVWVFHGGADPVVPVDESRKMVESLKTAGGNVKYSEYEGVGHNSWDKAYDDPEFAVWLFAQRLAAEKP